MAKERPILSPDALSEIVFPMKGIDIATEYELQPPGTTEIGLNVRAYEPSTMRQRGGSRPGLSQYIPQQTAPGRVQHLNYIVDPTTEGLIADDPANGDPGYDDNSQYMADPSTNNRSQRNYGRRVRIGGSGRQPNRNQKKTKKKMAFLQNVEGNSGSSTTIQAFGKAVGKGSLIVVWVECLAPSGSSGSDTPPSITLSDNQGNTYAQAGSQTFSGPYTWTNLGADMGPWHAAGTVALFYAVTKAAGGLTITATEINSNAATLYFNAAEFSNPATLPLTGVTTNQSIITSLPPAPLGSQYTTGSIPVVGTPLGTSTGSLLVAGLYFAPDVNMIPSKWVYMPAVIEGDFCYKLGATQSEAFSGTMNDSVYTQLGPLNFDAKNNPLPSVYGYFAIGASFKPTSS